MVTPEDVYFSGTSTSLIAPGFQGYLGILPNHASLVTPLVKGIVTLKHQGQGEKKFEIDGGFLEVSRNQVMILAEKITSLETAAAI